MFVMAEQAYHSKLELTPSLAHRPFFSTLLFALAAVKGHRHGDDIILLHIYAQYELHVP